MSIQHVVFVPSAKRLPSSEEWSDAAAALEFRLTVSPAFEPLKQSGGLLVRCNEVDAGFEYYCDEVDTYLEEVGEDFSWLRRLRLRRYRYAVSLVTHSREDDYFAAVVAAAALCHRSGGLLLDCTTGRFIASDACREWVRATAKAPSHAAIANRKAAGETVHLWIRSLLAELGYEELSRPPSPRSRPGDHWFARVGTTFPGELVEASIYADGEESFLGITFFATKVTLAKLKPASFMENAAGFYLFQALEHAGRSGEEVLPQNIPIDESFPTTATAEQLRRELREADAVAFQSLKKLLQDEGEL